MTTFLFFGNPGVGKSTCINALLGGIVADAKYSNTGSGITTEQKEYNWPDFGTIIDTPGLSDAKLRQEAAAQITLGHQKGGPCGLVFFGTMEAGRVRVSDLITMKSVMAALPEISPTRWS